MTELYNSFSDIESIIESYLVDFRALENQAEVLVRKLKHVEQSVSDPIVSGDVNVLLFSDQPEARHFPQ